ncbi:VOC family protein [Janibacter sp. GS2]|uniref:VOC family protein n=1 Tax=Janibacter sp. GS2 TaxID=3442646 RepID=UPI003EB6EEC3
MGATLRIEIFPCDIDRAVAFYAALGFELVGRKEGPPRYASVRRDEVRIGMVQSPRHPSEQRAVPIGTEIVIAVDDVRAERDRVVAAGVELAEDLRDREWGLTDFRVHDPDGYYLRVTDRR